MPSFMKLFDRTYLGTWDLEDAPGKLAVVTIADLDKRPVFNPEKHAEEQKVTMGFEGKKKRMVLNITNAKTIAVLYGSDYKTWPGKRITLGVARTRNGKDGIVVQASKPKGGKDTDERDMTHTGPQPSGTVTAPEASK